MFFIFLGFLDLLCAILMLLSHSGAVQEWKLSLVASAYLIGKGVVFRGSWMSMMDIAAGVYLLLIMLGTKTIIVYVFAAFLIYKFVISLILR